LRGNNQSKFYSSGDYGPITKVFQDTKFQRFLLEYDDDRSGGFERFVKFRKPNSCARFGEFKKQVC